MCDDSSQRPQRTFDTPVAVWDELADRTPLGAFAEGVDLVVVRFGERHSVLYGRCQHRGALMADGTVRGDDLICGIHRWDDRIDTGVSTDNPAECLHRFASTVIDGRVMVAASELAEFRGDRGRRPATQPPNEVEVHYGLAHAPPAEP